MINIKSLRNSNGSALPFVIICLALLSSYGYYTMGIQKRSQDSVSDRWKTLVTDQIAQSAFAIMESALERRMWAPPPDSNCLKSELFSVSGTTTSKGEYKVEARYIFDTNTIEMISTATYRKKSSKYFKSIKLGDVSDYIIYSKGDASTTIRGVQYSTNTPASIVARDKKIYFKGPVKLYSLTHRPPTTSTSNYGFNSFFPMDNPGEISTVIQSERMIFEGGLSYAAGYRPSPSSASYPDFHSKLAPYTYEYLQETPTHLWNYGGGGAFFTTDHALANSVLANISSSTPVSMSIINKHFYPTALLCGTPPLNATNASDSGCYYNDVNRWVILTYGYGYNGISTFGARGNFTCYSKDPNRLCSSSSAFPKSFDKWRNDADLNGSLFTDDYSEVKDVKINWDNMESFEEDALQCGILIDESTGLSSFDDCELNDLSFVERYMAGDSKCNKIYRLDSSHIQSKLANYNSSQYQSADPRHLRRIIYSKVPLEVSQTNAQGLASNITPNSVRKNLSLWFVNEDVNILKPHQSDLTSPLSSDPGRPREMYFNSSASTALSPLKLAFISPEQTMIHSPFHRPLTHGELLSDFPLVSGKIRPKYTISTDWKHQEEDGFKYGARIVDIKNVALVDNSRLYQYNQGIVAKGLWSIVNSSAQQFIVNYCPLSVGASDPIKAGTLSMPSGGFGSTVPPTSSKFYKSSTEMSAVARPHVFNVQNDSAGVRESIFRFSGTRLGVIFSDADITGKRNLATPIYRRTSNYSSSYIDMSHKYYKWDLSHWYNPVASNPCSTNPTVKGTSSVHGLYWPLNLATFTFQHTAPADDFGSLGAMFATPLPVLKLRNR